MAARAGLLRARAVGGGGGRLLRIGGHHRPQLSSGSTTLTSTWSSPSACADIANNRRRALLARLSSSSAGGGGGNDELGQGHDAQDASATVGVDEGGVAGGSERPRRSSSSSEGAKMREIAPFEAKYFVDLRMDERGLRFPEGLAGDRQGEVASYLERGTGNKLRDPSNTLTHRDDMPSPLLLMNRDSSRALVGVLDAYACGGTWGEPWLGRKRGTVADLLPREDDEDPSITGLGVLGDSASTTGDGNDDDDNDDWMDIFSDETEEKGEISKTDDKKAALHAKFAAELDRLGDGVPRRARRWRYMSQGKRWQIAQSLSEAKRKPLKPNRRVRIQPQQRSFLLTGARGVGKSCTLNQIVLHARMTGWIVIFVPNARDLLHRGIFTCPSPTFRGMFDLPKHSLKMLAALKAAHADQLDNIHIQDPEVLARHGGVATVLELLERGVGNEENAGTVIYDVQRELLATTEAKVLLAIDSYNEFFQPSMWYYDEDKLETPNFTATKLLVPPMEVTKHGYAFPGEASEDGYSAGRERRETSLVWDEAGKCLPPPPANGIVVCALSKRYPHVVKFEKKKWNAFEAVAGKMIQGVSIPVEPFTKTDMELLLSHYVEDKIVRAPLTAEEVAKVHVKSHGLPEKIHYTCASNYYA